MDIIEFKKFISTFPQNEQILYLTMWEWIQKGPSDEEKKDVLFLMLSHFFDIHWMEKIFEINIENFY